MSNVQLFDFGVSHVGVSGGMLAICRYFEMNG